MTYYIARDPTGAPAIIRLVLPIAATQLVVVVGVHICVLVAVLAGTDDGVVTAAVISVLALPAIFLQQYGLAILQGQGRFGAFNALRSLPSLLFTGCLGVIVVVGDGRLVVITAAWVVSSVAASALTIVSARGPRPSKCADPPPSIRAMLRFGTKGVLGSASPLETFRLDQAVVGLFLSPAALGLYVVGVAFTNLPRFVAQSIGMVAYPTVAESEPLVARRAIWRFLWMTLGICALIVAVIEVTAPSLVPLLFGDEFDDAVPIVQVLLLGALFLSVRRVLADCARGAGLPGAGTIAELVSWIVLLPALALLTPRLGVLGVAWAFTVSSVMSACAVAIILFRTRPSRPAHELGTPARR